MASLFRARRTEEGRSGGKILRGRRAAAAAASPYARPQSPPPLPSPSPTLHEQSVSPKWLSGLISGAGKLISSVFGSDGGSSSSSSSSGYSSDEDVLSSSNKGNDADVSQGMLQESNQGTGLIRGHMESKAIVPISDSKLAIEHLLMQETFSRDECNKLMKIIESRVVELSSEEVVEYGRHKELSNRTTDDAGVFSAAWHSVSKNADLLGSIPYSTSRLSALSPSPLQTAPSLCNTAVMEAKKWLEEKKLQSSSSSRPDKCGPCTLNTEMLEYGIEGKVGSPVDLAKSYMQSLPPWQSPFISTIGFKTPPPSGIHLYKDEVTHALSNYSLPLSKGLKRNYLSTELWDASEESQRVRLRSSEDLLDIPKFRKVCSSTRLFENGSLKISLADDGKVQEVLGTHQDPSSLEPIKTSGASLKLSNELTGDDHHSHETLGLSYEKAPQTEPPEIGQAIPSNTISGLKEAVTAIKRTDRSSLPASVTLEHIHTKTESGPKSPGHDVIISVERDDMKEPSQNEERDVSNSATRENLCEEKVMASEIRSVLPSDADHVTNCDDKNIPTTDRKTVADLGGTLEVNMSSDINLDSGVKEMHSVADSRLHDSDPHLQNNVNGLQNKISTNGSLAQPNANSDIESSSNVEPSCTNSSNAAVIADSCDLVSGALLDKPAVHETNEISRQSQNGTKMKSVERMLTEPKTTAVRRGRKRVVKAGRGK
ncbi:uncharacterized protein [Typha latifolia]|uniref:uncharacterized protein isoform X2 n=1 Tax=Typha latifolia TaxID=4733 RepID=UPI003C2E5702